MARGTTEEPSRLRRRCCPVPSRDARRAARVRRIARSRRTAPRRPCSTHAPDPIRMRQHRGVLFDLQLPAGLRGREPQHRRSSSRWWTSSGATSRSSRLRHALPDPRLHAWLTTTMQPTTSPHERCSRLRPSVLPPRTPFVGHRRAISPRSSRLCALPHDDPRRPRSIRCRTSTWPTVRRSSGSTGWPIRAPTGRDRSAGSWPTTLRPDHISERAEAFVARGECRCRARFATS
jgi:hypothetical protein